MQAPVPQETPPRAQHPLIWVPSTYFAEGFPYAIVNNLAEIVFAGLGASLQAIGLTSLLHLPWNLKFLWGPLLDHFETKRRWLLAIEVALAIGLLCLACIPVERHWAAPIAVVFFVLAVLSATHDIAIDGFYLEALDPRGQSRFVGFRAMAYKGASLLVRGPLLVVTGIIGWQAGWSIAAAVMIALLIVHQLLLPKHEQRKKSVVELARAVVGRRVLALGGAVLVLGVVAWRLGLHRRLALAVHGSHSSTLVSWASVVVLMSLLALAVAGRGLKRRLQTSGSYYASAFVDFLNRPKAGLVVLFVVLFRTGESFLQKMKWPFLKGPMEMSLGQYGLINGTLGIVVSFSATLIGGWLIARHGLRRWMWPFVLAQNVLNLFYAGLAMMDKPPDLPWIALLIGLESLGEGLGTSVFMVYLMRSCDPAHKAAHMAILTALMSVSFTVAGAVSGYLADALGFGAYFVFTFLATIPAMALLFVVPIGSGRWGAQSDNS